jgi:predicted Zn-dependent protease
VIVLSALGLEAKSFAQCDSDLVIAESELFSSQKKIEKILKDYPNNLECKLKLSLIYLRNNRVADGFRLITQVYAKDPNLIEQESASKVLDLALRLDRLHSLASRKRDRDLWNELGDAYFDIGIYKEASESYKKSIAIDQNQTDVKILLSVCYGNINKMREAAAVLQRTVIDDPNSFYGYYYLGKILKNNLDDKKLGLEYLKMAEYIFYNGKPKFESKKKKIFIEKDLKKELQNN